MTVERSALLQQFHEYFPKGESERLLHILFQDLFGRNWAGPSSIDQLPVEDRKKFYWSLEQLLQDEPVQYITGKANFYGYFFEVNQHVLIPRPETEELVYYGLEYIREISRERTVSTLLDVGTGSGCIPITFKLKRPELELFAVDVSPEALVIARKNARTLGAEVHFSELDFLDRNTWEKLGAFDMIVSNPPYIPWAEKQLMGKNVLGKEPELALFVDDDQPLIFYQALAEFGRKKLKQDGLLLMEMNEYNASQVEKLFLEAGYQQVELIKDMSGAERILKATKGSG